MEAMMKIQRFLSIIIAAAAFACTSCSYNNAAQELIDWPFETVYGSWTRTGKIGAMGVARLKAYSEKDTQNNKHIFMDFAVNNGEVQTFECAVSKQSVGAYRVQWRKYDKTAKTAAQDVIMTLQLSFESKNELYLITDKQGMGGMTLTRDKER